MGDKMNMRNSMKRFLKITGFATVVAILIALPSAYATPTLTIIDGSQTITVTDGGFGDFNPADGAITYIGFTASQGGFKMDVTTGESKPLIGSALAADMDLNVVYTSNVAGTLTILLTDSFFGPLPDLRPYLASVGGTTTGSVTFETFINASNVISTSADTPGNTLLTSFGTLTGPAFSGSSYSEIANPLNSYYSLTEKITITNGQGGGNTSVDASLRQNVPEPSALLLLGSGFSLLGIWRWRKQA
jgi:hypothetical protein